MLGFFWIQRFKRKKWKKEDKWLIALHISFLKDMIYIQYYISINNSEHLICWKEEKYPHSISPKIFTWDDMGFSNWCVIVSSSYVTNILGDHVFADKRWWWKDYTLVFEMCKRFSSKAVFHRRTLLVNSSSMPDTKMHPRKQHF